jgi:hypothetical protein
MSKSTMRGQLNGTDGLLLAVIDQAVRDFKSGGPAAKSARAYFNSPIYIHHLNSLGLPADSVPVGLEGKIKMNEHYEYASLAINEKMRPVTEQPQRADNAGEWDYTGLAINAAETAIEQGQGGNADGWDYTGLVANAKPAPGPQPGNPHKQFRYIKHAGGKVGAGVK